MRVKQFRPAAIGERVRVHKNLQNGRWTIRTRNSAGAWSVAEYRDEITLSDATPKASEAGARRINRNGKRSVVACIEGTLESCAPTSDGVEIHYNPFRRADFHSVKSAPQRRYQVAEDGIYRPTDETWCGSARIFFPAGGAFFLDTGTE